MKDIYLVHDDQESPVQRKNFLEMAGYNVTLLQHGEDCLRLVGRNKPSLVLSDVLIHGMTGFELCRRIRDQFSKVELPVILATTIYTLPIFQEEAAAVGAQRYLIKPIKLNELLAHITRLASSDEPEGETRKPAVA